jgi:hypothetical protein
VLESSRLSGMGEEGKLGWVDEPLQRERVGGIRRVEVELRVEPQSEVVDLGTE